MAKKNLSSKDLSMYQRQASDAMKPAGDQAKSGAARSSYEETTFGANAGSGPNRSRNVHKGGGK